MTSFRNCTEYWPKKNAFFRNYLFELVVKMEYVKTEIARNMVAVDDHVVSVQREIIYRLNGASAQNEENLKNLEGYMTHTFDTSFSHLAKKTDIQNYSERLSKIESIIMAEIASEIHLVSQSFRLKYLLAKRAKIARDRINEKIFMPFTHRLDVLRESYGAPVSANSEIDNTAKPFQKLKHDVAQSDQDNGSDADLPQKKKVQKRPLESNALARRYLQLYTSRNNDTTYGVNRHNDKWFLGADEIRFLPGASIRVGNYMIRGTPGLYELLFRKESRDLHNPTSWNTRLCSNSRMHFTKTTIPKLDEDHEKFDVLADLLSGLALKSSECLKKLDDSKNIDYWLVSPPVTWVTGVRFPAGDLLEKENGLQFEKMFMFIKSLLEQTTILHAVEQFVCNSNEAIVTPCKALRNSIFAFHDIAYDKLFKCIQEYFSMGRNANINCVNIGAVPVEDTNLRHIYNDHDNTGMMLSDCKSFRALCWKDKYRFLTAWVRPVHRRSSTLSYSISEFEQGCLKLHLYKDDDGGFLGPRNNGICDAGRRIIRNDAATKNFVLETGNGIISDLMAVQNSFFRNYVFELMVKMECVKTEIVRDMVAIDEHVMSVQMEIIDRLYAGNRTPVSHVTGGDTNHYTTEDNGKTHTENIIDDTKKEDILQFSNYPPGTRTNAYKRRHVRINPDVSSPYVPDIHRDSSSFLLQPFYELSNGFWPRLTSFEPAIQFDPKMFYRVEVWDLSGPVQSTNIVVGVPLHSSSP
ncbi:hypothetical protein PR048_026797 [Dryococelus australis]|uniref:DUF8207 domain-containing protein n=1 Tax=Dryococelus australis TaxID=614101 RepID=A0ABQ9GMC2_9NEOP|nr:hypothetical protein PR048_026797 [Dryococelus australis]